MKKFLVLLLAGLIFICCTPAFANVTKAAGVEFELDVALPLSEPLMRNIAGLLDEITEKTDGRVQFNTYPSNSLVSLPELPGALKDGIADMVVIPSVNYPSIFAYNAEVVGLPFIGMKSANMICDAWKALYDAFPELQEEWDAVNGHLWYQFATTGYNLYLIDGNADIHNPEDLAGHKIMTGKIPWLNFISAEGGAGVQAAPTVYYENLEKGVSDGVVQSVNTIRSFGCMELIHSGVEFGTAGSYFDMFYIAINQDVWDSFPEDIQQAFNETNIDNRGTYSENDRVMEDYAAALTEWPEAQNIIQLNDEEVQVWAEAMKPFIEDYLVELKDTYQREKINEMYDFVVDWVANNADNY